MKDFSQYKHIIWDWNGTLLDDVCICIEIINKMLAKRELRILSKERYKQIFGFPIKDYYIKAGFDFNLEPFQDLAREYITEYDGRCLECTLHAGVIDILQKVCGLGITQSVLSASNEESLRNAIEGFGIKGYFTHINGLSNDYAESKISIGCKWLSTQRFDSQDVLLIGDTEHDFEVADAMRVDCILISHGHQGFEKLRKNNTRVFESILQLEEYFRVLQPSEGFLAVT